MAKSSTISDESILETSIDNFSDSSFGSSDSECEENCIEDTAFASIISRSTTLQNPASRRFLSTTLSSFSSDESIAFETSEFDNNSAGDCSFASSDSECEANGIDCIAFAQTQNRTSSQNPARHKFELTSTSSLSSDDGIVFETSKFDSYADTEVNSSRSSEISDLDNKSENSEAPTCDFKVGASGVSDCRSGNLSNNIKLYWDDLDVDRKKFTMKWVQTFNASTVLDKTGNCLQAFDDVESFRFNDLNSYNSLNLESTPKDRFIGITSPELKRYEKKKTPLGNTDGFSECEETQNISNKPKRACKVTFAPDERLVTVHTFEREPEELLPNTHELDRIRFQMRIQTFGHLMVPFLAVEHRAEIRQRNSMNV